MHDIVHEIVVAIEVDYNYVYRDVMREDKMNHEVTYYAWPVNQINTAAAIADSNVAAYPYAYTNELQLGQLPVQH